MFSDDLWSLIRDYVSILYGGTCPTFWPEIFGLFREVAALLNTLCKQPYATNQDLTKVPLKLSSGLGHAFSYTSIS